MLTKERQRLTRLFDDNTEWFGIDHGLWLADTLESLRSLDGNVDEGTRTPMEYCMATTMGGELN